MNIGDLPRYTDFMRPILTILAESGGSGSIHEINDAVVKAMGLPDAALGVEYESGAGPVVPDRLSWARSHLKIADLLASGGRGVWLITEEGRRALALSEDELRVRVAVAAKAQNELRRKERPTKIDEISGDLEQGALSWQDNLLAVLRAMDPSAFERVCQRLLRESGFVKVEVTGRSGDGGIDGTGILQLSYVVPCAFSVQALPRLGRLWGGSRFSRCDDGADGQRSYHHHGNILARCAERGDT